MASRTLSTEQLFAARQSHHEAGYYLLQGTLVQSEAGTTQPRHVSMKLAPHTQQPLPYPGIQQTLTYRKHSVSTIFLETGSLSPHRTLSS